MKVEYIDHMGSDLSVVNAARVSFDKESGWWYDEDGADRDDYSRVLSNPDKKLIGYLASHGHWSPFAHTSISMRWKAPIFVARQLVKHQVGLTWNEVSRRYVNDPPEFFKPDRWRKAAVNVKQGSSLETLPSPHEKGKCLYCGVPIVFPKKKYCSNIHQAYHSQIKYPLETKFTRWRASAKESGSVFTITPDDLDWPENCPYLGMKLNYFSDNRADDVASLDKIVPELGYVPGNAQIISSLANKMKNNATVEQMLKFAESTALLHGGVFMNTADSYDKYLERITETYNKMVAAGYCAEQARMILPQSMYTSWVWTGSLYAWVRVWKQRTYENAQYETRELVKQIEPIIKQHFPVSWEALTKE